MVHATSQSASTEKNVKPCIETDTEEVNHKNQTKQYLSESESGDEYDEDLENAVSECSYQTATTSSVADTDISNICDQLLVLSTTNHKSMGSTRGKKKRGKTAKKAKKANRAQKITEEEIEAIKKKKKLDADKAYELRQEQMKIRQEKIDASDRNKIYRRLAQTAVDMLRKEERKLPPEIKQLDEDLEYYVENSKFYLRINLRDRYLETRVDEISEKYIGPALEHKTELLKIYEDLIKRSLQAFRLFMFLKTLNEKSVDYTKFEVLTLSFVMKGFEDDWLEVNGTYEENESYLSFEKNILHDIPETEQLGTMASRSCICQVSAGIIFLIGAALLVAGLVIVLNVFPNIVNNQINDSKVLGLNADGTLNSFTDSWVNSKYISTMQYWVYDYTNTIGIMNRAIYPDVREKGPYAFDEILTMDKLNFSENGEFMEFRQIQTFVFNPNKSCAGCDPYKDKVLIPDMGFQVGIDQIDTVIEGILKNPLAATICHAIMKGKPNANQTCSNLGALIEGELGTLISLFNVSPFTTVTVDQLLFSGYKTPFVEKFLDEALGMLHFLFGTAPKPLDDPPIQLNPLNGTSDIINTVLTGKTDPLKAGYMTEFRSISNNSLFNSIGNTLPPMWWPYANKTYCKDPNSALVLTGTNGDYFKNFVKKTDILPAFVSDVCRTIHFVFDREVTVKGFKGYRFVMPPTQFDYSLDENCGYCIPLKYGSYEYPAQSACLPSGLLDISQCTGGPIIMSKPHFYQASKVVSKFVPRFKPTYDNDETMLDIEPNTGTVLQAQKRLQINMLVNQFKHIRSYSVMRPGAYPLAWVNESFYMDQNTIDQLNSQLFTPVSTVNTICWIAVGLGAGLIALSIVMVIVSFCCFRDEHHKTS